MSRPEAVVMDLGDVLIRWEPQRAIAAAVGEEEAHRFLTAADFDFHAWNHEQDAGRPWPEAEASAGRTHPHWEPHVLGYRANFALAVEHPVPGTAAIVERLHAAGVPLFALTNWSAELFPVARARHAVLRLFDDIVVSGEEGLAKPEPGIFEALAARVGRPLERCVYVDDSARNVAAGARAGLDAIVFTGAEQLRVDLRSRGLPV
ncbi:MAG TPA: HAD family phosphatase [Nocardioidaceae bacterium]|nr:HAD family phosphatase [Nocardioidaceae bacterium]